MKTNKLVQAVEHTPGPWHIGMKPGPMIYGPNGEQVADMRADLLMDGEREANARLIAAAPELLEACKDALESLGFTSRRTHKEILEDYGTEGLRVFKRIQEAIAKAEGK